MLLAGVVVGHFHKGHSGVHDSLPVTIQYVYTVERQILCYMSQM